MSVEVTLPALGESVTEGTVTQWLKQVGDNVETDEPLLEVSTDKVDTEIPSPAAGVLLEIKASQDETVEVGAVLAVIGDASESGAGADASDDTGADASGDTGDQASAEESDQGSAQAAEPEEAPESDQATTQPEAGGEVDPGKTAESGSGAASGEDTTSVTLPELGESVTEGTVTQWLKQVGDSVSADEPLLEVSTDKVDTEIPSPAAGVLLEIKVQEDETVEVGAELAVIGAEGSTPGGGSGGASEGGAPEASDDTKQASAEPSPTPVESEPEKSEPEKSESEESEESESEESEESESEESESEESEESESEESETEDSQTKDSEPKKPEPSAPAASKAEAAESTPAEPDLAKPEPSTPEAKQDQGTAGSARQASGDGPSYVTPLVRKLAAEHSIELASLKGTGVGGRIRKQDVLEAATAAKQADKAPTAATQPAAAAEPSPLRGKTEKMSRLRRTIAKRMVESLQVSAQLTTVVEVDVTGIARLRSKVKAQFEQREGVKLSFLPFFAKATVDALKVYPQLNATIDSEAGEVTYFDTENLAIAVDTERGLLTPVIKGAGDLSIAGLSRKIADVAARTRGNKITPDELSGGTFTLTNTGSRGALFDTPIINQPQVAVLGTGTVVKRPVVIDDANLGETIAVRHMVYFALTYDHRLVDGADAARFLVAVKQRLEEAGFETELGL